MLDYFSNVSGGISRVRNPRCDSSLRMLGREELVYLSHELAPRGPGEPPDWWQAGPGWQL